MLTKHATPATPATPASLRTPAFSRRLTLAACALLTAWATTSCGEPAGRPTIHLVVTTENQALFESFVAPLEGTVVVDAAADPASARAGVGGVGVALVATTSGDGSYRIERSGSGFVVTGDAPLGLQYGAAHLLERLGYRFFHPFRTHIPASLAAVADADLGVMHTPDRAVRGIHLHTLHPIEGYFELWEPSAEHLAGAERIIDWLVKNRGNYLQWPGLDNIQRDAAARDAWATHTRAIIAAAHARGVRIGFGVQLYGASNLQLAYDLVEANDTDVAAAVDARLDLIADVPFDSVQLSFGEFLGAAPATFVANLDTAVAAIRERWPLADVSTVVHMGNYPQLTVSYMSQTLNYYFLSRFAADPAVVPWIHSVMYYDLYEDAGGAYGYDAFTDHRAYLYERLMAGQPVVYFPETAYWIAFDDSIPNYLPLYVRSRVLDLARSRADGLAQGFDADFGHVLFSSGWEWGYWQNDWAALRASYELPARYEDLFDTMFEPWGAKGQALADALVDVTETEADALIVQRLSPWLASRDWTFDAGDAIGVYSQPSRPSFPDIAMMSPADRATFRADVVDPMGVLAAQFAAHRDTVLGIGLPTADPFLDEVRDGVEVNVERATFVHELLLAVLAFADVDAAASTHLAAAEAAEARAATIIDRRHAALHYPDAATIRSTDRANATTYKYGYLREAETRCFYERERIQVQNLITGSSVDVPFCALL